MKSNVLMDVSDFQFNRVGLLNYLIVSSATASLKLIAKNNALNLEFFR